MTVHFVSLIAVLCKWMCECAISFHWLSFLTENRRIVYLWMFNSISYFNVPCLSASQNAVFITCHSAYAIVLFFFIIFLFLVKLLFIFLVNVNCRRWVCGNRKPSSAEGFLYFLDNMDLWVEFWKFFLSAFKYLLGLMYISLWNFRKVMYSNWT